MRFSNLLLFGKMLTMYSFQPRTAHSLSLCPLHSLDIMASCCAASICLSNTRLTFSDLSAVLDNNASTVLCHGAPAVSKTDLRHLTLPANCIMSDVMPAACMPWLHAVVARSTSPTISPPVPSFVTTGMADGPSGSTFNVNGTGYYNDKRWNGCENDVSGHHTDL